MNMDTDIFISFSNSRIQKSHWKLFKMFVADTAQYQNLQKLIVSQKERLWICFIL